MPEYASLPTSYHQTCHLAVEFFVCRAALGLPEDIPDYFLPDWLHNPSVPIIRFPAYLAGIFGERSPALKRQRLQHLLAIAFVTENRLEAGSVGREENCNSQIPRLNLLRASLYRNSPHLLSSSQYQTHTHNESFGILQKSTSEAKLSRP